MSRVHEVTQGECLSAIAYRHGFTDWRTIYNDPANANFRKHRPNPNIIFPGDEIVIPDRKLDSCSAAAGQRHRFRRHGTKARLRLALQINGEPLAGHAYELKFSDMILKGTTTSDGRLDEGVPIELKRATLLIGTYEIALAISHLDPMDGTGKSSLSGVQARLCNLGYGPGPIDGIHGPRTRSAIIAFQRDRKLQETGDLNDAGKSELSTAYGC
jgi:hypothetical protein